jgi:hypothetical protein
LLNWNGLVPLEQVLAQVRPAYGGDTWEEALASLYGSPGDAATIAELVAAAPNGFSYPIRIGSDAYDSQHNSDPDDSDPDDPDNEPDDEPDPLGRVWYIANGMHRIAAATSMGHTHILSRLADAASVLPDGTNEYIEVVYRFLGDLPEDDADEFTYAVEWLRSFPLPDGTWVESDIFSSSGGEQQEGMWRCPHHLVEELLLELTRRAPLLTVESVRCVTGAQLDAELGL